MKHANLLRKLSIKQTPNRKTKAEFKRDALEIVRKYAKYKDDPSYQYFLSDLFIGLSEDCEYLIINDLIKDLQRIKKRNIKYEDDEIW